MWGEAPPYSWIGCKKRRMRVLCSGRALPGFRAGQMLGEFVVEEGGTLAKPGVTEQGDAVRCVLVTRPVITCPNSRGVAASAAVADNALSHGKVAPCGRREVSALPAG